MGRVRWYKGPPPYYRTSWAGLGGYEGPPPYYRTSWAGLSGYKGGGAPIVSAEVMTCLIAGTCGKCAKAINRRQELVQYNDLCYHFMCYQCTTCRKYLAIGPRGWGLADRGVWLFEIDGWSF